MIWGRGHTQAKVCGKPPEAKKGKEIISALEFSEETSLTDTLTLAQQTDLEVLASWIIRE